MKPLRAKTCLWYKDLPKKALQSKFSLRMAGVPWCELWVAAQCHLCPCIAVLGCQDSTAKAACKGLGQLRGCLQLCASLWSFPLEVPGLAGCALAIWPPMTSSPCAHAGSLSLQLSLLWGGRGSRKGWDKGWLTQMSSDISRLPLLHLFSYSHPPPSAQAAQKKETQH